MPVEGVTPQHLRESQVRPSLDQAEVVEALRHGNIYEVLRTPGINRRDIEEYLAGQFRLFQNQIAQDYQVYSNEASLPPPELATHFAAQEVSAGVSAQDHQLYKQDMASLAKAQEVPGEAQTDITTIASKTLSDWNDFFSEIEHDAERNALHVEGKTGPEIE